MIHTEYSSRALRQRLQNRLCEWNVGNAIIVAFVLVYHKSQASCLGSVLLRILMCLTVGMALPSSSPWKTGDSLVTIRTVSSLPHLRCSKFRCRNMTYEGVQSLSHSQTSLLQLIDNRCRSTTGRDSVLYDPNQTAPPRVPLAMGDRFPPFASKPCV